MLCPGFPHWHHSPATMEPEQLQSSATLMASMLRLMEQYFDNARTLLQQEEEEVQHGPEAMVSEVLALLLLYMPLTPLDTMEHRFWRRESSTDWWDHIVMQGWDDQQWLQNFRMRKATFLELCEWLDPALRHLNTRVRPAIPVQKRVAIALWKLATSDSYRSVGNQFGVGKSRVRAVLLQVAKAINHILLQRFVTLGNIDNILDGFADMGFPNCGGVIDGTHIPIVASDDHASNYINQKGYCSMVLQALVDHKGRFTDINVGWSGKAHNTRILQSSSLFSKMRAGTFFPHRAIKVGELEMPIMILGDAAYPLLPWLMKPYTGRLDASKEEFNNRLRRCRMVVKCAFGRLKGRFRSLLTRLDISELNMPFVVAACCVLHNLCENKGETFLPAWGAEAERLAREFEQPDTSATRRGQQGALFIRDALKDSFMQDQL